MQRICANILADTGKENKQEYILLALVFFFWETTTLAVVSFRVTPRIEEAKPLSSKSIYCDSCLFECFSLQKYNLVKACTFFNFLKVRAKKWKIMFVYV